MSVQRQHILLVRTLYKRILRLHKRLPAELQQLGDQYAREEFKRHKKASPEYTVRFMKEWVNYSMMLSKQVAAKNQTELCGM